VISSRPMQLAGKDVTAIMSFPEERLLGRSVADVGLLVDKRNENHSAISTHGEPCYLLMHLYVHYVHQFVSRTIAFDLKLRNFVSQILLEFVLRAEDQLANARMKSVRTDPEIELTLRRRLEWNATRTVFSFCSIRVMVSRKLPQFCRRLYPRSMRRVPRAEGLHSGLRLPEKCIDGETGHEFSL